MKQQRRSWGWANRFRSEFRGELSVVRGRWFVVRAREVPFWEGEVAAEPKVGAFESPSCCLVVGGWHGRAVGISHRLLVG